MHAKSAGTAAHQTVPSQGHNSGVQDEGISERRDVPGGVLNIVVASWIVVLLAAL